MKKITLTMLLAAAAALGFSQQTHYYRKSMPVADSSVPVINIGKEPRFIINVHSGFSVGLGSTFKFYPDDISSISVTQNGGNTPNKSITYANPSKGLGDGFKFGFGGSYILNDFINVGIDFDYFNSTIKKYRDSSNHQTNIPRLAGAADEYTYSERNITSYQATLLSLTPNITFKAISRPKWFLYNKIGAIITFRPNSLQDDVTNIKTSMGWQGFYKDSSSSIVKKYQWGIRNPAFGFMGAFGGQVKIADRIRLFAEAQFSHIVFVIRNRMLTDYIVDNQHKENDFSLSEREVVFVKSFTNNSADFDPNKPTESITQRIPITYIGLQVGVAFQFK